MGDLLADALAAVFGRAAPEDPLARPSYRRSFGNPTRSYTRFAYRSEPSVGTFPRPQEFEAVGDHLLLDELVGSEAVYVRVGEDGNPWIRMEEGDELTRSFDRVWVTVGAAPDALITGLSRSQTEATFIASFGPTKRKGAKAYGFRRGFKAFRGSASTIEQSVFAPILAIAPSVAMVFGKRGGVLYVRNRGLANTLLVRHGVPGVVGSDDYWELYPGECQPFRMEQRLHSKTDTLIVATSAGTCDYGALASAFDVDRADLDQEIMRGI